jgi:NitT/TauT family transport system permease protein
MMILGVVAMVIMIVAVDWMVWRPLVVWSQKFKVEETEAGDAPKSAFLEILRRSRLFRGARRFIRRDATRIIARAASLGGNGKADEAKPGVARGIVEWLVWFILLAGTLFGAYKLASLLSALTVADWLRVVEFDSLTLLRVLAAVALGTLWTVPVGVAIGLNPKLAQRLQPVTQVLASFPAPMLFPLVIIVLHACGVTLQFGSILLMMLGTQWYLLFNVVAGAMSIPQDLREAAAVYRLDRMERWKRLILPGVFPSLVTGWVTATGGAWNASIVAEYLHFKHETLTATGLGAAITQATDDGNFPMLGACVLVMCLTVVLINRTLWRALYRLAEERFSLNK